jgi:hypothetical protein
MFVAADQAVKQTSQQQANMLITGQRFASYWL